MATTVAPAPTQSESPEIKSREDAESALETIKSCDLQIQVQKLRVYKVDLERSSITRFVASLEKKKSEINNRLREWSEKNRKAEFGGESSLSLLNGVLEFKFGPAAIRLLHGWTDKGVIGALRRKRMKQFIRIKEEIDRQQIGRAVAAGELDSKRLESVGLESSKEEFFTVKPQ